MITGPQAGGGRKAFPAQLNMNIVHTRCGYKYIAVGRGSKFPIF